MVAGNEFFDGLRPMTRFRDVADPSMYRAAPDDWFVVITDVRGSTKAIEAGRYKEVNVLGAASIAAVLDELDTRSIPFVFGGDGATLLVPPDILETVKAVLVALAKLSERVFAMDLRIGVVPVAELDARGEEVLVGRYNVSGDADLAMFWGSGIGLAEDLVKDPETEQQYAVTEDDLTLRIEPDFKALECRWKPIPARNGQMSSILVMASENVGDRSAIYQDFLDRFDEIIGEADCRPVVAGNLEMGADRKTLRAQAKLHTGASSGLNLAVHTTKLVVQTALAQRAVRRGTELGSFDGSRYVDQLVHNTDFRKFDDVLRMVVDIHPEQEGALRQYLEEKRREGLLTYGIHTSDAALMTCMIFDYDRDHIHFVDGSAGGYALAAREMKGQAKER